MRINCENIGDIEETIDKLHEMITRIDQRLDDISQDKSYLRQLAGYEWVGTIFIDEYPIDDAALREYRAKLFSKAVSLNDMLYQYYDSTDGHEYLKKLFRERMKILYILMFILDMVQDTTW